MKLPNRLTYQGSIDTSPVTFHAIYPSGETKPLRINSTTILGSKGSASEGFSDKGTPKENVTRAKLAEGNPHELDCCNIPYDANTVICEFSVTIEANVLTPKFSADSEVTALLEKLVALYGKKIGFEYLAKRYLSNIVNGVWLWRNQKTHSTTVSITQWQLPPIIASDVQIKRFEENWEQELNGWEALTQAFTTALQDPKRYLILEIKAELNLPKNSRVHPSQVFKENQKGTKGRTYQTTEIDNDTSPIFGAYKTGAAIAMIDDWYPNAVYPIRISSYGVDKKNSTAHRPPDTGLDIFSLLMNSEKLIKSLESKAGATINQTNQLHFIMANLIKGGLFQLKGR